MEAEAGKRQVTRDHRPLCVITSYPARTVLFNRAKVQAQSLFLSFLAGPVSLPVALPPGAFPLRPRTIFVDAACVQQRSEKKSGKVKKRCSEKAGLPFPGLLKHLSEKMIFPHFAISMVGEDAARAFFGRSGNISPFFSFGRPPRRLERPSFSQSLSGDGAP